MRGCSGALEALEPVIRQAIFDLFARPLPVIEEIDRVIASGVRFGCVLADPGYGSSGPFRQALSERGLKWAVGLSRRQNVYPAETTLIFPVAKTGNRRKYHIPDRPPVSAEAMLAGQKWRKVSWRQGTKGRLSCRFAALPITVVDRLASWREPVIRERERLKEWLKNSCIVQFGCAVGTLDKLGGKAAVPSREWLELKLA